MPLAFLARLRRSPQKLASILAALTAILLVITAAAPVNVSLNVDALVQAGMLAVGAAVFTSLRRVSKQMSTVELAVLGNKAAGVPGLVKDVQALRAQLHVVPDLAKHAIPELTERVRALEHLTDPAVSYRPPQPGEPGQYTPAHAVPQATTLRHGEPR